MVSGRVPTGLHNHGTLDNTSYYSGLLGLSLEFYSSYFIGLLRLTNVTANAAVTVEFNEFKLRPTTFQLQLLLRLLLIQTPVIVTITWTKKGIDTISAQNDKTST